MKLDQIAYYAHNEEQAAMIKRAFGLNGSDWVDDIATGLVEVRSMLDQSSGHLQFNYELGIELEILTYLDGPHWHEDKQDWKDGKPFISHIGFHMEEGEPVPKWVETFGTLVQVMDTKSHTNEYVRGKGRTYHYEIFSVPFGPDMKFIWRKQP